MQDIAGTKESFTEAQATDEAMLLLTRRLMRLHSEAYADVWKKLPEGARRAILAAEIRADVLRDKATGATWAPEPEFDDED